MFLRVWPQGRAPHFLALPLAALFFTVLLTGCADDTTAPAADDGRATFDFVGEWSGEEMVLQRVEVPGPAGPVAIELVATGIRVDDTERGIQVDVALRNAGNATVYGPIRAWIGRFVPEDVRVINSDDQLLMSPMPVPSPEPGLVNYFTYVAELGEDMALGAGEQSRARSWHFELLGAGSFSFACVLEVGTRPDYAAIAGHVFFDENKNGQRDPGEPAPFEGAGRVTVRFPDGHFEDAHIDADGAWAVAVRRAGLYEARYLPPPTLAFAALCYTTPNPMQIVLTPGPNGTVRGFDRADFGIDPDPCIQPVAPPVRMFDGPPDSIETDDFALLGAAIVIGDPVNPDGVPFEGIEIRVGFSGCGPDHPFDLFAGSAFMESDPVQTWLRLSHDDRGEICAAWFERSLLFDLAPLRRAHFEAYGTYGPIILRLEGPRGVPVSLRLD